MSEHFNKLTPAEAERLAMLAEECGEVIQMVGKILRHGYHSHHPDGPAFETNRFLLSKEMQDVFAVWEQMERYDGADSGTISDTYAAWQKKLKYAHHQSGDE